MTAEERKAISVARVTVSEVVGMLVMLRYYADDQEADIGVSLLDALGACERMAKLAVQMLDPLTD